MKKTLPKRKMIRYCLSDIAKGADMETRFREGIVRLSIFLVGHASGAPDVPFEKEERRGKGKKSSDTGIPCPLCQKGRILNTLVPESDCFSNRLVQETGTALQVGGPIGND